MLRKQVLESRVRLLLITTRAPEAFHPLADINAAMHTVGTYDSPSPEG